MEKKSPALCFLTHTFVTRDTPKADECLASEVTGILPGFPVFICHYVSPDSLSVWLTIPFILVGAGVASLHTGPWATTDGMEYRMAAGSTGGGSHWLYQVPGSIVLPSVSCRSGHCSVSCGRSLQ